MERSQYRKKIINFFFAVMAVLWLTPTGHAQSWRPLDPSEVLGRISNVTRERYPDADTVVVARQGWASYETDGTSVEWFEQYTKVLTEKGRRDAGTITSSFTIPYNTTRFVLVEIISEGGAIRTLDVEKNSREMVDPSQMASNIYNPNDRLLTLTVPGLSIGDTVHFIIEDRFTKPRMPGTYGDIITFEGTDPIVYARHTIVAPSSLPLRRIAVKNEIPKTLSFITTRENDRIIYQWTARDVPRAFEEPEMPPLYSQVQRVLVSTIGSWEDISRWYWNLCRPALSAVTPTMRTTVKGIVKGKKGRRDKIEAVFYWVSRNIRYLGITAEAKAPGYEPHPVSMTFERRAGVCRDKAALLVAMLRIARVDAFPVLIMNGPKKEPEVPQPFFNHAIACVRNPDGSYLLMDPTDESTTVLFPSYLANQSYLVATPTGETLMTSPVESSEKNAMRIRTVGVVDSQGTLRAETTLVFGGVNDNAYRGHLSRLSREETRAFFERMLLRVHPGAFLQELMIEPKDMLDTGRELTARLTYTVSGYAHDDACRNTLRVFRFGDVAGLAPLVIKRMGLKERKYPYVTETTCGVQEEVSLELDPSLGVPLMQPREEVAKNEACSWRRYCGVQENRLVMKDELMLELTEYSPENYNRLMETLKRREQANRYVLVLDACAPKSEASPWYERFSPDAVVLKDEATIEIQDSQSIRETVERTVKVVTYAGIKGAGEIHIPFIPAWEEVGLEEAVVRSPKGEVRTIEPREINIMDQPWAGTAPRYSPGRILVASFPGIQKGSVVTYRYTKKRSHTPDWIVLSVFCDRFPVEAKTLRIEVPSGMEIRTLTCARGILSGHRPEEGGRGPIQESVLTRDGKTVYEYTVKRMKPLPSEDNMPPAYMFAPVLIAGSSSLDDFSERMVTALEDAAQKSGFASGKAREICRDILGDQERVYAVRNYIEQNIRGVDIDMASYPLDMVSPADTTLADAYGHQLDKAVLTYAMLKSLGYDPDFVLASRFPSGTPAGGIVERFPSRDWFDALLVKVRIAGQDVYLGDTDQYAAPGVTAHDAMMGFDLATRKWTVIHSIDDGHRSRTETDLTVDLDARGDAVVEVKRIYRGMDAAAFVKTYSEMTPEERRRRFEEMVTQLSRAAQPEGPYVGVISEYPPYESFRVRIEGLAYVKDNILTMDIPGLFRGVLLVTTRYREAPLFVGSTHGTSVAVTVRLPREAVEVMGMPSGSSREEGPGGVLRLNADARVGRDDADDGRLVLRIEQEMDIRGGIIWPEGHPSLLALHDTLAGPLSRLLAVRLGAPAGDGRGNEGVPTKGSR